MAEQIEGQVQERDFYPLFPGTGRPQAIWADLARQRTEVAAGALQDRFGGQPFRSEQFRRHPDDPKEGNRAAGDQVLIAMLAEALVAVTVEVDALQAQIAALQPAKKGAKS